MNEIRNAIVAWLTALWDEDEATANQVSGRFDDSTALWVHDDDYRHDSLMVTRQAVLADIAAKRMMIDPHNDHDNPYYDAVTDMIVMLAWGYRHRRGWRAQWIPGRLWPYLPYPHGAVEVHRYELTRRSDGVTVDHELIAAGVPFTYRPEPWEYPGYPDAYIWRIHNCRAPMQPLIGELECAPHVERAVDETDAQWVERVLADVAEGDA